MSPEERIVEVIENISEFDFDILIYGFGIVLVLLWLLVAYWVWSDSRMRSRSIVFSIVSVIFVLPLNIPGLLIYLLVRPANTIESLFWTDLERRFLIHETADLGDCETCGYQLSPDFDFCPQCAAVIREPCKECDALVKVGWDFCAKCGCAHKTEAKVLVNTVAPKAVVDTQQNASADASVSKEEEKKEEVKKEQSSEITDDMMRKSLDQSDRNIRDAISKSRMRFSRDRGVATIIGTSVLTLGKKVDQAVNALKNLVLGDPETRKAKKEAKEQKKREEREARKAAKRAEKKENKDVGAKADSEKTTQSKKEEQQSDSTDTKETSTKVTEGADVADDSVKEEASKADNDAGGDSKDRQVEHIAGKQEADRAEGAVDVDSDVVNPKDGSDEEDSHNTYQNDYSYKMSSKKIKKGRKKRKNR